jgi:Big-like domain-containing protein
VVTASGAPYYHEIFQVSDLSAAGTYPTTNYPDSVSIAADGTTPQATGPATIIGNYSGGDSHAASRGLAALTVTLRATTTALTCQHVLLVLDKCTATVSDSSSGTAIAPTGTVTFTSSRHGIFSATTCTLAGSGPSASCSVRYTPLPGSQTLTASYGGDSIHQPSTGTITLK